MRIVVCVTGASGSIYARRFLSLLVDAKRGHIDGLEARPDLDIHWIASSNAPQVWRHELGETLLDDEILTNTHHWERTRFDAPFASGSNVADAVVCIPCSMSTLARVAHGGGDDLIARTCEVALKERKVLVLVTRETPLSLVHLRNMVTVTEAGAVVLPAVPSFYGGVRTLDDAVDTVVVRALDHAGLRLPAGHRWKESNT